MGVSVIIRTVGIVCAIASTIVRWLLPVNFSRS